MTSSIGGMGSLGPSEPVVKMLAADTHFAEFAAAMYQRGQEFVLKDAQSYLDDIAHLQADWALPPANLAPGTSSVVVRTHHPRWLDACHSQYLQSRKRYTSLTSTPFHQRRWRFILVLLVVMLAAIFWYWPVWNRIIDLESDVHYTVLELPASATTKEVKSAYRKLVKKWHPDVNPGCGQMCADMMLKLQKAHDVLLERGTDDSRRGQLQRNYQDALRQIFALVFFRMTRVVMSGANFFARLIPTGFVATLLLRLFGSSQQPAEGSILGWRFRAADVTDMVLNAFRISFTVLLNVLCFVFVVGFDPVAILSTVASLIFEVRSLRLGARRIFRGRLDARYNAACFIASPVVLHLAMLFLAAARNRSDGSTDSPPPMMTSMDIFHIIFGATYVGASLVSHSPNLFDNIKLRQCLIPADMTAQVQSVTSPFPRSVVTPAQFVFAHLRLCADDVLAFSTGMPFVYRAAAILAHVVFLLQMAWYPWQRPADGVPIQSWRQRVLREESAKTDATMSSGATGATAAAPTTAATRVVVTTRSVTERLLGLNAAAAAIDPDLLMGPRIAEERGSSTALPPPPPRSPVDGDSGESSAEGAAPVRGATAGGGTSAFGGLDDEGPLTVKELQLLMRLDEEAPSWLDVVLFHYPPQNMGKAAVATNVLDITRLDAFCLEIATSDLPQQRAAPAPAAAAPAWDGIDGADPTMSGGATAPTGLTFGEKMLMRAHYVLGAHFQRSNAQQFRVIRHAIVGLLTWAVLLSAGSVIVLRSMPMANLRTPPTHHSAIPVTNSYQALTNQELAVWLPRLPEGEGAAILLTADLADVRNLRRVQEGGSGSTGNPGAANGPAGGSKKGGAKKRRQQQQQEAPPRREHHHWGPPPPGYKGGPPPGTPHRGPPPPHGHGGGAGGRPPPGHRGF